MKKIENNFVVTGFVGKDAEIRQFSTASSTASRSKTFSIEDMKESVPSAMNVKAARMISKSYRLIKKEQ